MIGVGWRCPPMAPLPPNRNLPPSNHKPRLMTAEEQAAAILINKQRYESQGDYSNAKLLTPPTPHPSWFAPRALPPGLNSQQQTQ